MDAVILETDVLGPASQLKYDDSLTSYQFPSRYLRHFQPLTSDEDMLAIIYEPRGKPPRGRMAYVGWAVLRGHPQQDTSGNGTAFRVNCIEAMRSFERPVPREIGGEPIERWLRAYPRGHLRNTATRGRAVRSLAAEEVEIILRLGASDVAWDVQEASSTDKGIPKAEDTRIRQLVTRIGRSARFRLDVLAAYGMRCAVSGFSANGIEGLIEAAHIRGVGRPEFGPDHVTNGIALTPTLHRLFDRHLFSLQYVGEELLVVTSSQLAADMVQAPISDSRLRLESGQRVRLPSESACRPSRTFVDSHRSLLRS